MNYNFSELKLLQNLGRYNDLLEQSFLLLENSPENKELINFINKAEKKLKEKKSEVYVKLMHHFINVGNFLRADEFIKKLSEENFPIENEYLNKGQILYNLNKIEEAKSLFLKGVELNQSPHHCYFFLGLIEKNIENNYEKSLMYQENSLQIKETAIVLNEIANMYSDELLSKENALIEAGNFYKKAIECDPKFLPSYGNLSLIFERVKKYEDALNACLLPFKKDNQFIFSFKEPYQKTLGNKILYLINILVSSKQEFKQYYKDIFNALFSQDFIRYIDYRIAGEKIIEDLISEENIEINIDLNSENFLNFINNNLVNYHLRASVNMNIHIEKIIIKIRKLFLEAVLKNSEIIVNNQSYLRFLISLANQCLLNEYVWETSKDEEENLKQIKMRLKKSIETKSPLSNIEILILISYQHIFDIDIIKQNKSELLSEESIIKFIKNQIHNYENEEKLSTSIEKITPIDDEISLKVKEQYEKYPYPRWNSDYLAKTDEGDLDYNSKPELECLGFNKTSEFPIIKDVLIAGCGTGQHPIEIAKNYKDIKIDAIDLSKKSLAYGKSKANELNITNINWFQADILKLNLFDKKYDAIESVGVLHHLKEPKKGFDILTNKLNKNGILKIGLYARSYRNKLTQTKDLIKQKIKSTNLQSIKEARKLIYESNDSNIFNPYEMSGDFYSLSSFIDLLMHKQELDFNINELIKLYEKNYEFLGFVFSQNKRNIVKRLFRDRYKTESNITEIEKWRSIEDKNPHLFSSMYQFWLKKI